MQPPGRGCITNQQFVWVVIHSVPVVNMDVPNVPHFRDMFAGGSFGLMLEVLISCSLFIRMKEALEEKDWKLKCTDKEGDYMLEIPKPCRNPKMWAFAKGDCGFVLKSQLSNTEKECVRISLEVRRNDTYPRVTGRAIFIDNAKSKLNREGKPTKKENESHHEIHHDFFTSSRLYNDFSELNLIKQGTALTRNRLFLMQMFIEGFQTTITILFDLSASCVQQVISDTMCRHRDVLGDLLTQFLRNARDPATDYFIISPATKFLLSAVLKLFRKKEGIAYDFEPSFFELASKCSTQRYPTFENETQYWCADLEVMESLVSFSNQQVPFPTIMWLARSSKVRTPFGFLNWMVANLLLMKNFGCTHECKVPDLVFLKWWNPMQLIIRLIVCGLMDIARVEWPAHFKLYLKKTKKFYVYSFENVGSLSESSEWQQSSKCDNFYDAFVKLLRKLC